jgi:hypothetical protein
MEKLTELLENIENFLLSVESDCEREMLCIRLEEMIFDLTLRVDHCDYERPHLQVL